MSKSSGSGTFTNQKPPSERPAADWVQADIVRAFELRRDYYKYTIGVATALLAFTTSFPPKLSSVEAPDAVIRFAWPALGIAIICGISVHYLWAWFFIAFRDFDNHGAFERGRRRRRLLSLCRRTLELVQIIALIVGVMGTGLFASRNFGHVGKAPTAALSQPQGRSPT